MIAKYLPTFLKSAIKNRLQPHVCHWSQAGQDLWVSGEAFNEMRQGFFLDIGAHDGIYLSNTYLLERKYDWTGICVEANPDSFERLRKNRRATCIQACLDSAEGFVDFAKKGVFGGIISANTDNNDLQDKRDEVLSLKTKCLEKVLAENGAPMELDYVSIDVEGAEERILGNFNFKRHRFKCLTIERPNALVRTLLREAGYILVKDIPRLDCFFVHESFVEQYCANLQAFYLKKQVTLRWH
jgi:FkbM family methyltransferase